MFGIPDTSDAGLPGSQRCAIESAACESEPKLIHLGPRQRPVVLQRNAVGASQRVADDAGRDEAAAVRQRRDGPGVVAQVRVAAKDSLSRVQIVVEAHAELILIGASRSRRGHSYWPSPPAH